MVQVTGVVYVLGVALNASGRLGDELMKTYGISTHSVDQILRKCGLLRSTRVGMLTRNDVRMLERIMNETYVVGYDLRRKEHDNIQRHRKAGTYKGVRIRAGLPVHGQRTSTNAKTAFKLNKKRCKI